MASFCVERIEPMKASMRAPPPALREGGARRPGLVVSSYLGCQLDLFSAPAARFVFAVEHDFRAGQRVLTILGSQASDRATPCRS